MPPRTVIPELLDHLPEDDPAARRSRCDLRRINFLMGNERWICRSALKFPEAARRGIVEMGAGDGRLCRKLATHFPGVEISAYDLAPPPSDLPSGITWQCGDLFEQNPPSGGILVANLFLHHFEAEALWKLGRWMENFELLLINEPDRARLPHLLGGLMHPFINHVTRHDMHVSIDAGFSQGEIPRLLGLDELRCRESSTWRGSRRVVAWRH